MDIPARTRVGAMAIGLEAYWAQFPGMWEYLVGKHRELVAKFPDTMEIIDMGMVDTRSFPHGRGGAFWRRDVDLVFVQLMTYSPSDNMIPAVKDLDVPVILLNVQERKTLDLPKVTKLEEWLGKGCTCAGLPELSAMLIRYNLRFDIVTGCLHGDRVVDDALNKWCRVAGVRRKMRSTSIGLLGRQFSRHDGPVCGRKRHHAPIRHDDPLCIMGRRRRFFTRGEPGREGGQPAKNCVRFLQSRIRFPGWILI